MHTTVTEVIKTAQQLITL